MANLRRRLDGVMVREVVEDILLLDTESGQIHKLNPTASLIWRNCEEVHSAERIADMLEMEFDVTPLLQLDKVPAAALREGRRLLKWGQPELNSQTPIADESALSSSNY